MSARRLPIFALAWVVLTATALGAGPPGRVPWSSSRFVGTPDPPLPFAAELAFPKLRFDRPVLLESAPDSPRLFIGELGGKVWSFPDDPATERTDLVVDLAKARPGFSALYGMAFHPQFAKNPFVFLCYVLQNDKPDGTRVSRFRMSRADPPRIELESETVLLTWLSGGHNGGCLAFGPDGMLYISTGDGAGPTPPDPLHTGQDLGDLLSSVLRIDVDHEDSGRSYRVPPDNPFVPRPDARPEIWAYGLRNPWKMSFDRATGDLWLGDVGWELWELIYRVERGGNYGWSIREGRQPVHADGKRGPTPILPPIVDHPHSEAASITGGYVYRGDRLKDLIGVYVYGDYQSGKVWGLRHDGRKVTWQGALADTGLRLVSFGTGRDGELYLVEHERSNQIYRLVPNPAPKPQGEFPRALSRTGLFASTADQTPAPGVLAYAINAAAWADGATAERFLAIPGAGRIDVDPEGTWKPPEGAVLAKTVAVELRAGDPSSRRKLETQVLHLEAGSWRPYSYIWDDAQTDATLVDPSGASRLLDIRDDRAPGGRRALAYRFAARAECARCHNPWVGTRNTVFGDQSASPLALIGAQLDRDGVGVGPLQGANQLQALEQQGYFDRPRGDRSSPPRLVDPYDATAGLDARARAYLQVNCAHCHQFNAGGAANIALSAALPLEQTRTLDVRPIQGTFGIDDARIIAPGAPERSVLYYRLAKTGAGRMPRLGAQAVDDRALRLFADWIARLPRPAESASADLATVRAALGSPSDRPATLRRLLESTSGALLLVRLIDQGHVSEPARREAIALAGDVSKVEVRDLFERFLPDSQRTRRLGDTIDPDAILALTGDAGRGRQWFRTDAAAQCRSCHRAEGEGTDLGPDLGATAAKATKRDLLRHVLEPSREVDPKFATHAVATRDGQVYVGLLVEKSASAVILRDARNQTIRIRAADVERAETQPASLMPEGLLRDLTAQQAADLLEYLASLTPAPR